MFARAFDAYVSKDARTTPVGDERTAINAQFDALVQEIQTKETDGGNVAMYRHGDGHGGASIGEVTHVVEEFLAQFAHQAPVRILDSAVGVLPGASYDSFISGAVHGGRIHLFLENIPSRSDAAKTLWHEMLHYGLRRFLSKGQFIAEMRDLYKSDMWVRGYANKWFASDDGQRAVAFGGFDYEQSMASSPYTPVQGLVWR